MAVAVIENLRHIDKGIIESDPLITLILVGGSDSYRDYLRLGPLSEESRLLTANSMDGFAPGEAACFILLTRHPEMAMVRDEHIIALHPPGIADEPGHLGSEQPYLGEGLDQAFKKALVGHQKADIQSIFSSMNGENHWAREYGVANLRNKSAFSEMVEIEHPADQLGDLGNATGTLLIALAAEHLFNHVQKSTGLVYCSSDSAKRGAIVIEKIPHRATP